MAITARSGGVGKAFTAADAITKSLSLGTAVAVPLAVVFAVVIAFIFFMVCKRRKDKKAKQEEALDEARDPLTSVNTVRSKEYEVGNRARSDSHWDSDEEEDLGMKRHHQKMYEIPLGNGVPQLSSRMLS